MVKLLVAVLIMGMISSPVKPIIPQPVRRSVNPYFRGPHPVPRHVTTSAETTITTAPTTTASATTRPPNFGDCAFYNPVPGIQYRSVRLHTMEKNWEQARITCELENAILAVPRSGREIELYMDHVCRLRLGEGRNSKYWIGLRQNNQDGTLTTAQGDTLTYKELNQSSPIPFHLWYGAGCWLLNSRGIGAAYCDTPYSFLCEKENCG